MIAQAEVIHGNVLSRNDSGSSNGSDSDLDGESDVELVILDKDFAPNVDQEPARRRLQ